MLRAATFPYRSYYRDQFGIERLVSGRTIRAAARRALQAQRDSGGHVWPTSRFFVADRDGIVVGNFTAEELA